MCKRLVLSLSICLISAAAVTSSATVVDPAGSRSNEQFSTDKDTASAEVEGATTNKNKTAASIGSTSQNDLDKYDVTMSFLENKVWDVIVVTDEYGLDDKMANEEDDIFMKAVNKTGRTVHRASIQDEYFDWRAGKAVVIRTAWTKVRKNLVQYQNTVVLVSTHTAFELVLSVHKS